LFLFACLLVAQPSLAAETTETKPKTYTSKEKAYQYDLWFGAGLGVGYLESWQQEKESSKPGYTLGVHGYLSRRSKKTQLNLGLGWENTRFLLPDAKEKSQQEELTDVEVRTKYAALELSLVR